MYLIINFSLSIFSPPPKAWRAGNSARQWGARKVMRSATFQLPQPYFSFATAKPIDKRRPLTFNQYISLRGGEWIKSYYSIHLFYFSNFWTLNQVPCQVARRQRTLHVIKYRRWHNLNRLLLSSKPYLQPHVVYRLTAWNLCISTNISVIDAFTKLTRAVIQDENRLAFNKFLVHNRRMIYSGPGRPLRADRFNTHITALITNNTEETFPANQRLIFI